MNRRPTSVRSTATPEEAAAIMAALERFARDTRPPRDLAPPPGPPPWARAGLLEANGYAPGETQPWDCRPR